MSHIISSETGIEVQRLIGLVQETDSLKVHVRWNGLPHSEDTLEPVGEVHKDVSQLFRKMLARRNTSVDLASEASRVLHL